MKVSPFGKSETKTKGRRKSGSINRPVLDYDWYGECTRSTHPSVLPMEKFLQGWRDSFETTRVKRNAEWNSRLLVVRHCSLSRENKFFQKFFLLPHFRSLLLEIIYPVSFRDKFVIYSHFIFSYFRSPLRCCFRFISFLIFNFIFRDFISVYFVFFYFMFYLIRE